MHGGCRCFALVGDAFGGSGGRRGSASQLRISAASRHSFGLPAACWAGLSTWSAVAICTWRRSLCSWRDGAAPERLAERLGLSPAPLSRVPRRKRLLGKPSEVLERLTGRESTEVQVRCRKSWSNPDEAAEVDERFANLHVQLSMRSIN